MAGNAVQRASTSAVGRSERLDYWNRVVGDAFDNIVIDADEDFEGEAEFRTMGVIEFARVRSSPACVRRLTPMRSDAKGARLKLHVQEAGDSLSRHAGLENVLTAGEFMLCDASQPYVLEFNKPNHMLVLRFPTDHVAMRLGDHGRYIGRASEAKTGSSRVLTAFLRSVWDTWDFDPHFQSTLPDVILDMMVSALRPCAPEPQPEEARLVDIKSYIEAHLCDPDLRASSVARAMGLSSRSMQMTFARAGLTLTDYILRRRLDLAADRLNRSHGTANITQLAYDIGFSDLTYFSKRFKSRFGLPPRDYRHKTMRLE